MLFGHIVQLVALVWMGTMWSPGVSNSGVGGGGGGGGVTVDGIDVDDVLFDVGDGVISSIDDDDGVLNNGRAGWLRWTPISANISSLLTS